MLGVLLTGTGGSSRSPTLHPLTPWPGNIHSPKSAEVSSEDLVTVLVRSAFAPLATVTREARRRTDTLLSQGKRRGAKICPTVREVENTLNSFDYGVAFSSVARACRRGFSVQRCQSNKLDNRTVGPRVAEHPDRKSVV